MSGKALVEHFSALEDPRQSWKVVYPLPEIMLLVLCATLASAEALLSPEPTAGSGELDEIAWLPLDEARALDLPAITRFVLGELAERLEHPNRPLPFVRMVRGRHTVEHRD